MKKIWIELRSSLWFVPGMVVIGSVVLALGFIEFDAQFGARLNTARLQLLLGASPDGARGMLTAIASSMITVAGVAFSITIVTLSLASTQYTPRILRNFMGDRASQWVLGAFVGIFTYCLIVLRSIRSPVEGGAFVPLVAIFAGLLLALLGIVCLIFFIHHVAASIQASYILHSISHETLGVIDKMFPEENGDAAELDPDFEKAREMQWQIVKADRSGYLQAINNARLVGFARTHDSAIRLERIPGDFVVEGTPLIATTQPADEGMASDLRAAFIIGDFRSLEQDAGFGFRQIVDIGMKALSPGINDTSTAVSCLDYLSVLLARLGQRKLYPLFARDEKEVLIIAELPSFEDYVAKAFDEIRLSADANVTIYLQLLCAVQRVAHITEQRERRRVLVEHVRIVLSAADRTILEGYDRERINRELHSVREALALDADQLPPLPAAARAA